MTTALLPATTAPVALPDDEERFVREYFATSNATQSYLRTHPRVRVSTAGTEGWKLLQKPQIQLRLEELRREERAQATLDLGRRRRMLELIATADFRDVFEPAPGFGHFYLTKDLDQLTPEQRAVVQEITVEPGKNGGQRVKVRLYSRLDAIKELNRLDAAYPAPEVKHTHEGEVRWVLELPRALSPEEWRQRYTPQLTPVPDSEDAA